MKSVKIAELKDRLSAHLRAVERGNEVTVMDRDRPIARIVPVSSPGPTVTLTPPKLALSSIRSKKRRPARWAVESSVLLAEERRER